LLRRGVARIVALGLGLRDQLGEARPGALQALERRQGGIVAADVARAGLGRAGRARFLRRERLTADELVRRGAALLQLEDHLRGALDASERALRAPRGPGLDHDREAVHV